MIDYSIRLQGKINARNKANAAVLAAQPAIIAAAAAFIGQKVQNQTGQLSAKFKAALPVLPGGNLLHGWYSASRYSLTATFKTCEIFSDGNGCTYAEANLYIGELSGDGKLMKVYPPAGQDSFHTNYTEAEIRDARLQVRAARQALSVAESKLAGFGEHDNS